jgi:hypothetical protein|tara:strand:+ start:8303 stop:9817 length:1515 start_codon:yes stop_codon:yes gene_type:complete
MITFPQQDNNFNYVFGFTPKTGEHSWSLTFGNQSGHVSKFDNLLLSGSVSGDFNQSYSLAQNNDYLAIGDPAQGIVNTYENFYYTINRDDNRYVKRDKLFGVGPESISGFGESLSLIEDHLFVGAPNSNDNSGSAFVYKQFLGNNNGSTGSSEWGQSEFINGFEPSGYFGCRIATVKNVSQYITAISATGENNGEGSVYIHKDNLLNYLYKLAPSDSNVSLFGRSVYFARAQEVRYLAIAYEQGGTGKIKMYKESSDGALDFSEYRTLTSSNPSSGDLFGYSIEGDDDYFVVGCPNENNSGAAYYYKYNYDSGFFENKQRIVADDLGYKDNFGKNVSFNDKDGVITSDNSSGKAYIYYNNDDDSWEQVATITGSNSNSGSFGGNIYGSFNTSIYNHLLMIGSSNETGTYIYKTGEENFTISESFSLSGVNNKLYDNDGNFLYGYNANKFYEIKGNVFPHYSTLYIRDHLYNSNMSRQTGYINAWDFSGGENLKEYYLKIYDIKN